MRTLTFSLLLSFLLPLAGGCAADSGSQSGPKGAPGTEPGAESSGGAASTEGVAKTDDKWTVQFTQDIGATGLTATVATTESCCGGKDVEAEGSPARLYLAPAGGGAGYLLFLGKDDAVVLAAQTGPGAYDQELYRSTDPATRDEAIVTLTVPADKLPGGDLRIWAATRSDTTVAGQDLALKLDDGSIPCAMLKTGKTAEPASIVGGDTPPPSGMEPESGDPDKDATDSAPPPPGLEPKSGDPTTEQAGDPVAPPTGAEPKTGDPKAPAPPQGAGAKEVLAKEAEADAEGEGSE